MLDEMGRSGKRGNEPRRWITVGADRLYPVEKVFGWGQQDSILRQLKLRGVQKVDWLFRFVAVAANLVRMVKLIPAV